MDYFALKKLNWTNSELLKLFKPALFQGNSVTVKHRRVQAQCAVIEFQGHLSSLTEGTRLQGHNVSTKPTFVAICIRSLWPIRTDAQVRPHAHCAARFKRPLVRSLASRASRFASKALDMYFRKIRPRATCL